MLIIQIGASLIFSTPSGVAYVSAIILLHFEFLMLFRNKVVFIYILSDTLQREQLKKPFNFNCRHFHAQPMTIQSTNAHFQTNNFGKSHVQI
jgi:hypothetical protein